MERPAAAKAFAAAAEMKLSLPRPSSPHPTPEALRRACSAPSNAESRKVLEHLATCSICSEERVHQESFENPKPVAARQLEKQWLRFGMERASRTAAVARLLPLAAALTLVAAGAVWLSHARAPERFRGGPSAVQLITPAGTVAIAPAEFVFSRAGADPVRIMVFDGNHGYRWTSEPTRASRVAFPEAEREKLRPGTDYFWTILSESETAPAKSFRLKATP